MITQISKQIYEQFGTDNEGGLEYFDSFVTDLEKLDPILLIIHQMRNYPLRYALDFLLSLPSLWIEFDLGDWKRLFAEASPRRRISKTELPTDLGAFADVHLVFRYIGLNPLPLIVGLSELQSSEKTWILDYCNLCASTLLSDSSNELDGIYYVSRPKLTKVRNVLLDGGLSVPEKNVENFLDALATCRNSF